MITRRTRRIIALILVVGILFSFSACHNVETFEEETKSEVQGLVCISREGYFIEDYNYHQYIFYDPETLVMYTMITGAEKASMTVLYNADGTPKLYKQK